MPGGNGLKDHRKRLLEERMKLAGPQKDQGLVFASKTGSPLNPSNLRPDPED